MRMNEDSNNILEILERKDRVDISGNRMTSFGYLLGGGNINYWDGKWDGSLDMNPIFNGTNAVIDVYDSDWNIRKAEKY